MSVETMDGIIPWLLDSEAWIEYRTRLDLLGQSEDDPEVAQAYQALVADPSINSLIDELAEWPGVALKSHKKAGHLLHKLGFLADIGLRADHPGIEKVVRRISELRSAEGVYQILMNISPHYGGKGEDELVWMLCDAPLVTYAMAKFGLKNEQEVLDSLEHLTGLQKENGWPCAVTPDLGKFKGPGSRKAPCPYANLLMLKLLTQFPDKYDSPEVKTGVETLLSLWDLRKETKPFLFAMGTDFAKLKAPQVWYDVLHVTDVLTQFPWAIQDGRLQQMLDILRNKADEEGKYTAESMWMDWKKWEFGQKKAPSKWITLTALRILKRAEVMV